MQAKNLQSSHKLFKVHIKGGRQAFSEGCDVPRTPKERTGAGVHYLTSREKATNYPLVLAAESCHSRGISHRLANTGMEDCLNKTLVTTAITRFVTYSNLEQV